MILYALIGYVALSYVLGTVVYLKMRHQPRAQSQS
jgi:hypothetical protein